MAAGLASLEVIKTEKLVENSATIGADIISRINALTDQFEFLKEARGKGSMIAIEFAARQFLAQSCVDDVRAANKVVLPDDHHPAVQRTSYSDPSCRAWHERDQIVAAADSSRKTAISSSVL